MHTTGLIKEQKTLAYLKSAYGIVPVAGGHSAIPVFTDGKEYFAGGFRWFYSLAFEAKPDGFKSVVDSIRREYKNVQFNVSLPFDPGTRMINYVLALKGVNDPEKRFDLYEGKTRNLVRKSYKNSFTLKIGQPTEDFYGLYSASMERLKSRPRSSEWFAVLEKVFSEGVVVFSLFADDKLIGVNYCLVSSEYVLLMFNVSDPSYWDHAVNDRLYDELVKWSIEHKVRFLDFGPSTAGDDSHNHFKEGFGAKRFYIFNAKSGSSSYRLRSFMSTTTHNFGLRLGRISPRLAGLWSHRYQIFRYLVSGGTAAAVDIGLLYAFTRYLGLWYLASAVLAFIIAFGVSFFLQKFWTFKDRAIEGIHKQAGMYLVVAVVNLCVNTLLVYLLTDYLNLWYILSQVIAAGLVALFSFFVYKYWIFTCRAS
jgi:putative flippase GtrA